MATTKTLAALLESNDMAALESLVKTSLVSASQAEKIEAVMSWADDTGRGCWETVCQLAQLGIARYVSIALRQEQELVKSGYEW